ncbi:etoposide-induced protein 2.4 homolog [Galendromus occidentalis]|uniref:Etoposide-induced protein 2.4 homolog n=1 Tax=Galendromus occidentalis TaxID=34638 RepID=A0AAJ6QZ60_9ACAR|nr:etoposide-induced protein 2.4 homolog [Galendromus occidentalis]
MATKVIGDVVSGVLIGCRDAVWGIAAIGKLDSRWLEKNDTISSKVAQDVQAFTALALRRRQQKEKTAPSSNNARPKIIHRLIQCCLLNGGVFMLSLLLFNYALLPGLQMALSVVLEGSTSGIWTWLEPTLSAVFGFLWVMPVFILTRIVNCIWFLDIADQAYRHLRGRPQALHSVKRFIVDSIFSYSVQVIFLIQTQLVCLFPIAPIGQIIGLLHLSILYSLYVFEYKWCNQGREFLYRLSALEDNWPYFVGFGMPLAVMTSISESRLIAGCLFAILFPLFIISATEAVTTPRKMRPLHLFTPSLWLTNMIFNRYIKRMNQQNAIAPPTASRKRE